MKGGGERQFQCGKVMTSHCQNHIILHESWEQVFDGDDVHKIFMLF